MLVAISMLAACTSKVTTGDDPNDQICIPPGTEEVCSDGIDQDCDGTPDDGCTGGTAERVYFEGFEDEGDGWKSGFRSDEFWNHDEPNAVAVVNNHCHSGNGCARGNLWQREGVNDPITGAPTMSNPRFMFEPAVMDSLDEIFIRYWFRLDISTWGCAADGNINDCGKLLWISDELVDTGAFYFDMAADLFAQNQGATSDPDGIAWLAFFNTAPYPWGSDRTRMYALSQEWDIATDGVWRKVEIYVNHTTDIMNIWIDGHFYRAEASDAPTDGNIPVPHQFKWNGVAPFYSKPEHFVGSISGPSGEHIGGWQVDDFEVYNGLP